MPFLPQDSDFYPAPRDGADLAAAWRAGVATMLSRAGALDGGIHAARSGGAEISGIAGAVAREGGEIAGGVSAAHPGEEQGLAGSALGNAPGVSQAIAAAEVRAQDPRAPVPGVDTGSGTNWIGGNAAEIRGRGGNISAQAGQGDNFERVATEGKRV